MQQIDFNTVQQFNDYYGFETLHPLVSVVRFDKAVVIDECNVHYGLYALFLKENKGCQLSYGRTKYDFDEMTVTSFAPGQTVHIEPNPNVLMPNGRRWYFIPTFWRGRSWGGRCRVTSFFRTVATRLCTSQSLKSKFSAAFWI